MNRQGQTVEAYPVQIHNPLQTERAERTGSILDSEPGPGQSRDSFAGAEFASVSFLANSFPHPCGKPRSPPEGLERARRNLSCPTDFSPFSLVIALYRHHRPRRAPTRSKWSRPRAISTTTKTRGQQPATKLAA